MARDLAPEWGVLEPIQTAILPQGQVEELKAVLEKNWDTPVTYSVAAYRAISSTHISGKGSGPS